MKREKGRREIIESEGERERRERKIEMLFTDQFTYSESRWKMFYPMWYNIPPTEEDNQSDVSCTWLKECTIYLFD